MASPTTIARKRNSMFSVIGSDQNWNKTSVTTLIFAILDAIAKEFGVLQDSVDAAKNDIHLHTIDRIDNLQAMWGDMLKENMQQDLALNEMIGVWRNLLIRLISGTEIDGVFYEASTPNNIRQLILDYSLVPGCRIFEFWKYKTSFAGAAVISKSLTMNDASKTWNSGADATWVDIDTLKALAYLNSGFQIFPEITGYTRNTNWVKQAADILKPYHNVIGFCWMLVVANALTAPADIAHLQLGTGNSGGNSGCSSPIIQVDTVVNNVDATRHVITATSTHKRAIGIVKASQMPGAAEFTEACLLTSGGGVIAGTYQTFSAVHKLAGAPVAIGYYYDEV